MCYAAIQGEHSPSPRASTMASYPINNIKSLIANHQDVSLLSRLQLNPDVLIFQNFYLFLQNV